MPNRTFYASTYVVADGVTRTWPFSFAGVNTGQVSGTTPYLYPADVKVQELYTDADGIKQVVQRDGVLASPNQLTIIGPPVISGREIRIYRETEVRFPLVDYRDLQSVSEHDLDLANRQAVFIAQETRDAASSNILQDSLGNYDAKMRRIVNLADGVAPTDAVNISQYRRTIRVPERDGIFELPAAAERVDRMLTFDSVGQPVLRFPSAESAADLERRLALPGGAGLSGWERSTFSVPLYGSVMAGLNMSRVNLWEFSKHITHRPNLSDITTWDWTPAVQKFVDYLVANHCCGTVPPMMYKLTDSISLPETFGWGIMGSGWGSTTFVQHTDNIPIFIFGSAPQDAMHSYYLTDITLTYAKIQPATNLNATPIRFAAMGHQGTIHNIRFLRGSYAIRVLPGVGGPWGQEWNNLVFGGELTMGAMDWTGAVNAVPNNVWGRFLVNAQNMQGPIFKEIRGYNWKWAALEMLAATDCQWATLQAGSTVTIDALKLEVGRYTSAKAYTGSALVYAPRGNLLIGQVYVGGTHMIFTPQTQTAMFNCTDGVLIIAAMHHDLTEAPVNFRLFSAASIGTVECRIVRRGAHSVPYTNVAGTESATAVTVFPDKNDKLSADRPDSDYTVAPGDSMHIRFGAPLTAPRVVRLPADDYCFNGLKYRIYVTGGAVNATNTLTVMSSIRTLGVLTTDKSFIELMWRRNPVHHAGWVVTGYGTLP